MPNPQERPWIPVRTPHDLHTFPHTSAACALFDASCNHACMAFLHISNCIQTGSRRISNAPHTQRQPSSLPPANHTREEPAVPMPASGYSTQRTAILGDAVARSCHSCTRLALGESNRNTVAQAPQVPSPAASGAAGVQPPASSRTAEPNPGCVRRDATRTARNTLLASAAFRLAPHVLQPSANHIHRSPPR